ncbi:hypothetical protein SLA2020_269000 [Shorea laevis]
METSLFWQKAPTLCLQHVCVVCFLAYGLVLVNIWWIICDSSLFQYVGFVNHLRMVDRSMDPIFLFWVGVEYGLRSSRLETSTLHKAVDYREMDGDNSGVEGDNWNTDDELEIDNFSLSSNSSLTPPNGEAVACSGEASSSAGSSDSKLIDHFIGMGFSEKMVAKAIQENGKENTDSILETLLTYSALESSPQGQQHIDSDHCSLECEGSFLDDFSDIDSFSDNEEITNPGSDEEDRLSSLVKMGYTRDEASIAIERCGLNSSLVELTDFITAAQMAKVADVHFPLETSRRLIIHLRKGNILIMRCGKGKSRGG